MFPIILNRKYDKPHPLKIPWSVAELAYSQYGPSSQTLERIAERGGFGPFEMDGFVPDWIERCNENKRLLGALDEATNWMFHAGGCDMADECSCGRNKHWREARAMVEPADA